MTGGERIKIKIDDDKNNVFWAVFILGLLEAAKSGSLTPEECEILLFNPYMKQELQDLNTEGDVIKMIGEGMELDDIMRLIPDSFASSLNDMKDMCISYLKDDKKIDYPINRYFDL